jgi:predicted component of type VI protein secretion system
MTAKLIVASGKSAGRAITLRPGQLLIGRAEKCDIRPLGEDVSREHCWIVLDAEGITVEDRKSRNGTFVNGVKIEPLTKVKVAHGDIVRVGPLEVKIETHSAREKPANLETGEDVSRWLMADDEPAGMFDTTQTIRTGETPSASIPAVPEPPAAEPPAAETVPVPAVAADDSASRATASVEALLAARGRPGTLPQDAKKSKSESSRDAAADALRKFFGKR